SNKGRPMNRSSDWTRRLSAGEDSASSSAAALTEPSRATWTKASMAVSGGRRRIGAFLVRCVISQATVGMLPRHRFALMADYPTEQWRLQEVHAQRVYFALAQ